jgi:enoyl-CoA hydratase
MTESNPYEYLRIDRPAEAIARITLARPAMRNAQNAPLLYELDEAFSSAAADDAVKVIILAADGPDFSSGHDLSEAFKIPDRPVATIEGGFDAPGIEGHFAFECEAFLGMCRRWREIPKPTIAQVHGRVIAGGLMLVWPMDLVVAAEDAVFSDPTVVFNMNGVEYFAHAHELGVRRAKELLFTGGSITAQEAETIGMVNRVAPSDQLADATLRLAQQIAARPAFGLRLAKASLNRAEDAKGLQQAIDTAFGLHGMGHANNLQLHHDLVDRAGIDVIRAEAKAAKTSSAEHDR